MTTPRDQVERRRRRMLWLICFLGAFTPNCTRCCPDSGGCSCYYAWEDCPPSGCNACSSSQYDAPIGFGDSGTAAAPPPASAQAQAGSLVAAPADVDASVSPPEAPFGGTLAFVPRADGALVVAAVRSTDTVRVFRVTATTDDTDPLIVRSVGDVAMQRGDEPGRVVVDGAGRARVLLRSGGAVATIDPVTASVVDRRPVCAAPRGMAFDRARDALDVACASGEVITLETAGGEETRRMVAAGQPLDDVAVAGDAVVASAGARIFFLGPDGALAARDPHGAVGAMRAGIHPKEVAVGYSGAAGAAFALLGSDGTAGPSMQVKDRAAPVSDLALLDDGTVAMAADGDPMLLAPGAAAFTDVGGPGLTRAVALASVRGKDGATRRVLALQTEKPRLLVLFTVDGTPDMIQVEPLE